MLNIFSASEKHYEVGHKGRCVNMIKQAIFQEVIFGFFSVLIDSIWDQDQTNLFWQSRIQLNEPHV